LDREGGLISFLDREENLMPSKLFVAAGVLLLMCAPTLPATAQTSAPTDSQATQPETTAPNEGPSHRLTGAAVIFNLVDRDGDGEIDFEEASTLFESVFVTLDADDNGKLSKDEINAALRRMHSGGREGHGYGHHHRGDRYR
jgi:hypothetical protein